MINRLKFQTDLAIRLWRDDLDSPQSFTSHQSPAFILLRDEYRAPTVSDEWTGPMYTCVDP